MKRQPIHTLDISGASDGDIPTVDTASGRLKYKAAAPVSGGLTVQDENGVVATGVMQLDFQGAGVTAAAGTGEVVVTIPGGSGGGDTAWTPATLTNGWVNYGSGLPDAAYRKLSSGEVLLRGTIRSGTIGQPAFTLPAGYRPGATGEVAASGGSTSSSILTVVNFKATGAITVTVGSYFAYLDGVRFLAEA